MRLGRLHEIKLVDIAARSWGGTAPNGGAITDNLQLLDLLDGRVSLLYGCGPW